MTTDDRNDVGFDYRSVKRRIGLAKAKTDRAEKLQFTREYTDRCARRFRRAKEGAPKYVISNIGAFVRREDARIAVAAGVLICFSVWIGSTFYVQYAEQDERASARKCSDNNLSYASNGVCYDKHRQIQTLNRDGTFKKGAMDWNVWRNTDFADRVANPQ